MELSGEVGTKVVRVILTRYIGKEVHDKFLTALTEIGHCNLSYDFIDKFDKDDQVPASTQIVQKSGSKVLEALNLVKKQLVAAGYAFRHGRIFIRPEEAR